MHSTSHYPMRHRTVRTETGCVRVPRQGRQVQRQRAIAESSATR